MPEKYKDIIRRSIQACNEGNFDAVERLVTGTYVRHDPNMPEVHSLEQEKQPMAMYLCAFLNLRFSVEDMIAESDKVASRYSVQGTHQDR